MSSAQVHKQLYRALEAKSLRSRSTSTKIADKLTAVSSTPFFLYLNAFIFILWILINTQLIPFIPTFDPYPFNFLTMVVSIEAIFLSIFVLVSQARAAQIATLREELHLRINLIAEQEITKSLQLLSEMRKQMKIDEKDEELERMIQHINTTEIEASIENQIRRADKSLVKEVFRDINGLLKLTLHPGEEKKEEKK